MNRKTKRLGLGFAVLALAGGATIYGAVNANADTLADRRVEVYQYGGYVADMCIKNLTQNNILTCTGKVGLGVRRELFIPYNNGDSVEFIVAVVLGHNGYHQLEPGDTWCDAGGASLNPSASCG
ncbi:MAG: hypothetical protein QOH97_1069 [Actinoplanes sp.]|nr:hypothetical protein [Actinoplanes sp.]